MGHKPYRLQLEMLPAYPPVLEEFSRLAAQQFTHESIDRIVTSNDVMAVGVLLSVETSIPLVYSRGRGESPVHDLIGAYDVGHPAVLLVGETIPETTALIQNCQRVGLEIKEVIVLIGEEAHIGDISVRPVLDFRQMLEELTAVGLLPKPQAKAILDYRR